MAEYNRHRLVFSLHEKTFDPSSYETQGKHLINNRHLRKQVLAVFMSTNIELTTANIIVNRVMTVSFKSAYAILAHMLRYIVKCVLVAMSIMYQPSSVYKDYTNGRAVPYCKLCHKSIKTLLISALHSIEESINNSKFIELFITMLTILMLHKSVAQTLTVKTIDSSVTACSRQ